MTESRVHGGLPKWQVILLTLNNRQK